MTTPEAEVLSERLKQLVDDQFTSVAMEVSSHALATQRVAGLTFDICIFTNLTHEHLDFHHSFDAYYDAKKSLFERHSLPESTWILPFESDVENVYKEICQPLWANGSRGGLMHRLI